MLFNESVRKIYRALGTLTDGLGCLKPCILIYVQKPKPSSIVLVRGLKTQWIWQIMPDITRIPWHPYLKYYACNGGSCLISCWGFVTLLGKKSISETQEYCSGDTCFNFFKAGKIRNIYNEFHKHELFTLHSAKLQSFRPRHLVLDWRNILNIPLKKLKKTPESKQARAWFLLANWQVFDLGSNDQVVASAIFSGHDWVNRQWHGPKRPDNMQIQGYRDLSEKKGYWIQCPENMGPASNLWQQTVRCKVHPISPTWQSE